MRRDARSQITIAAVALLLGLLVVIQARSQETGTGLEARSAQDLTLLVANLTTRNDQLRGEIADLERQLAAIRQSQASGDTSAGQLRADLARVRMWGGLVAAQGQGIRILVRGPAPSSVLGDLVNELGNAGAEALSVGGVRVVPGSVVAGDPGALSVENVALTDPIEVLAIGNSATLTGTLMRAGGVVAQVQATNPEVAVEVQPLDVVTIPATLRDLTPVDGKVRL